MKNIEESINELNVKYNNIEKMLNYLINKSKDDKSFVDNIQQVKNNNQKEKREIWSKEKAINTIIENFDFVKVHTAMEALDWGWATYQIAPTIDELKEHATELLNKCYEKAIKEKTDYFISCGGFIVNAKYNKYFKKKTSTNSEPKEVELCSGRCVQMYNGKNYTFINLDLIFYVDTWNEDIDVL